VEQISVMNQSLTPQNQQKIQVTSNHGGEQPSVFAALLQAFKTSGKTESAFTHLLDVKGETKESQLPNEEENLLNISQPMLFSLINQAVLSFDSLSNQSFSMEGKQIIRQQILEILTTDQKIANRLNTWVASLKPEEQQEFSKFLSSLVAAKENKLANVHTLSGMPDKQTLKIADAGQNIVSFMHQVMEKHHEGKMPLQQILSEFQGKTNDGKRIQTANLGFVQTENKKNPFRENHFWKHLSNQTVSQAETENKPVDQTKVEMPVKTFNLSQLQMQNRINFTVSKESTFAESGHQETIHVNKHLTEELGKVMIKNLKFPNGISQTSIQLHPKELGQIHVKLITQNGQITAQFFAETVVGKELLDSQMHQLRQSLVNQGFHVDRIDVQQSAASTNDIHFDSRNGFAFSERQDAQQEAKEQHAGSFKPKMEEEEEWNNPVYSQSGIDYTA